MAHVKFEQIQEKNNDTYGHTPIQKAFEQGDVYGINFDKNRQLRSHIRLGIIGVGGVAQSKYFPAIARLRMIWEPIEVVAFAELREDQAKKVQAFYGGIWYSDYRIMLREAKLDGIIITSPDNLHVEQTLACLDAGIPVLVEKPIARSLNDARRMCQKAQDKSLILMTVANKRYSPPYYRAKKMISYGTVCNPAMFIGKFNLGYDYIDLFESGTIHLFDITRYLMGDVRSVRCIGINQYKKNKYNYPIDNAIITFEFSSGSIGMIYTSSSALNLKPWERVEVYGNHAWLDINDQYQLTLYDTETGPAKSWSPVQPNTLFFDEEFGGFMGIIENFAQAIRGVEQSLVSGWDGYKAYELLTASIISLLNGGQIINLPLNPELADQQVKNWLSQNLF